MTIATDRLNSLPWVEKFRPQDLNDLVSHQDIISTIKRFMDQQKLPHLLFYGPPGTGKQLLRGLCIYLRISNFQEKLLQSWLAQSIFTEPITKI